MEGAEGPAQTLQISMGICSALGLCFAFVFVRDNERLTERIAISTTVMAGIGAVVGIVIWLGGEL